MLFVGRPEERKGLPVLLQAFEGLVEHVPARLTVIGATDDDVKGYLGDPAAEERIDALGTIGGSELWRRLHEADVLCAPSLAGESFGMVLTEAFAAGTPVIASEIAGYADVVTDGVDGILVPPADPQRLAEELQELYLEPERRLRMGRAARESAQRYAWPNVAAEVVEVYEQALRAPEPATETERIVRVSGLAPIDGSRPAPAERLPSLDPAPARAMQRQGLARKLALGVAGILGIGLTALAANKIGLQNVVASIVRSDLSLVFMALGLMMLAMMFRAASWYAIARAALPYSPLRRRDVTSATMIGVLMSATLPARLGEPARAMVLSRRTGRMRSTFPVLLGTLVSQTVFNIAALVLLGVIIVSSTDLFHSSSTKLFAFSLVPLVILIAVLLAPVIVRRQNGSGRVARISAAIRAALLRVRTGLSVFRESAPRVIRSRRAARCLGRAAPGLRRAVQGAGDDRRGNRRGRGGSLRRQRHRGRAGDAVEHRRVPARRDQRAHDRVRRGGRRCARLRRHPPGGRGRDGRGPRASRPRPRGPHVVRHAPASPERGARSPVAAEVRTGCHRSQLAVTNLGR